MSWQVGAIIVVALACIAPWVIAQIIHDFGPQDDEWDNVAERKRRIERQAKKLSGEHQ